MTDGHASYPAHAVNLIKGSTYINKVEFLGVGFGSGGGNYPVIKQMADAFPNGKM